MKGFASDNYAGVHPDILEALIAANTQHAVAYGNDPLSTLLQSTLKNVFGQKTESFLVFNGTAANILALSSVTQSYQAILCAKTAHIQCDECGAPEANIGCKLLSISTSDGKLRQSDIAPYLAAIGVQHHSQPKVISISQPTELGTVYSLDELRELANYAHRHGLLLHMDGARISNAAASLNCTLAQTSIQAGVDILSFGGTKNGLMYGEAVVFSRPELAVDFIYRRKQNLQLASKMRYIAAQFLAYLSHEQWRKTAQHANKMAGILAHELVKFPQVQITQKVEANGVFAILPPKIIPQLQALYPFYVWNESRNEVRWMTSWDTTSDEVYEFIDSLKDLLHSK